MLSMYLPKFPSKEKCEGCPIYSYSRIASIERPQGQPRTSKVPALRIAWPHYVTVRYKSKVDVCHAIE